MSFGLVAVPVMASAQPAQSVSTFGFLGENPSGKPRRDGTPLISRPVGKSLHAASAGPSFPAECPVTIHCIVVPAAYEANDGNIEDYGNYDFADRPNDMQIDGVVIHDAEGTLQSVIDAFQNPRFYASAHYIVDGASCTVVQFVQNKNVAWHAGNWYENTRKIGIEHTGFAASSGSYTPCMYRLSAELVKYLAALYHFPLDRGHIVGHDNVSTAKGSNLPTAHVDPGPYWNWSYYMALLGAPVPAQPGPGGLVTVFPIWQLNQQQFTGCNEPDKPQSCVPPGAQPSNTVQLRTQPSNSAPFFSDPILGQGSMAIGTTAGRLNWGQTFGMAGFQVNSDGIWYAVWVNGVKGWFGGQFPTAYPSTGKAVTPRAGLTEVPLYGRPIPEDTAYPPGFLDTFPPSFWIRFLAPPNPLPYRLQAGQRYALLDPTPVVNDQYYCWSSTANRQLFPYDHTVFKGTTQFYRVQSGNRYGYVKADDVELVG